MNEAVEQGVEAADRFLDGEVVNMLKRASPLPQPPESVSGATLEYRIPIGFDPPR